MNEHQLRRKVSRWLCKKRRGHEAVRMVVDRILQKGWEAYLVGGALRDLALGQAPRDIDIVICNRTYSEIFTELADFDDLERVGSTQLGGFRLKSSANIVFDVWPLNQTLGFKEQGLEPRIENFPHVPFLNLDAIVLQLSLGKGRVRRVYERGFFAGINNRLLEVNYEKNPFPALCLARAIIIAVKFGFRIGPGLIEVAAEIGSRPSILDEVMEAQRRHYGRERIREEEFREYLRRIQSAYGKGEQYVTLSGNLEERLGIWTELCIGESVTANANLSGRIQRRGRKGNGELAPQLALAF